MSLGAKDCADLPLFAAAEQRRFLTIAELNELIKGTLEKRIDAVWVVGEISNFRIPPSGHFYFTLKDERAQINAVMFRRQSALVRFVPDNGMEIMCFGRVSVYSARGDLQLYVDSIEPRGQGALYVAFEQLKRKLAAEGLFDEGRKRPLPFLPRSIGIVTSRKGAALHDMLRILGERFAHRRVIIRPVKVQGDGAAMQIAVGIRELARSGAVDVMIVGRGGGSLEDLWAFNEEVVARAIAASPIPVISAVGHEVDFTIADFVADLRAPTPSAAAELIVPDVRDLQRRTHELQTALEKCCRSFLVQARARLRVVSEKTLLRELSQRWRDAQQALDLARDSLLRKVEHWRTNQRAHLTNTQLALRAHNPARELTARKQNLQETRRRLGEFSQLRVAQARQRWERAAGLLRVLGPEATLERGYSITRDAAGKVIRRVAEAKTRTRIKTRVRDGEFESTVE